MTALLRQGQGGGSASPRPYDYWQSGQGLGNITPRGKVWPEGETFPDVVADMFDALTVVELGCGIGRLAQCFKRHLYTGVDICPDAIQIARVANPGYRFDLLEDDLPRRAALLAHTVLLHVPDDELADTLGQFTQKTVVISEIMGRKWRRAGNPPVFNRERGEYLSAMEGAGYALEDVLEIPYPHYRDTNLTMLTFARKTA